jgi:hypothetical protein
VADFLINLEKLIDKQDFALRQAQDFAYWGSSHRLKESYREKVWPGFSGKEKSISVKELNEIFDKFLLKVRHGLKKGFSRRSGMTLSYYINEVKKFNFIYENGKKKLNKDGLPLVRALSFTHRPVSLFLEGPMHAMRVMGRKDAALLHKAIRKSAVFDKKLKMYKVNEPLKREPLEIGRSTIFTPGWLENESVWSHMEYKYLLELLKKGLYEEFFSDLKNCLVAFQDPERYGRSILENSSFIASSAYPDENIHGNGFVARLTGTTTEFLTMWLLMCLGRTPFRVDNKRKLYFEPSPIIPGWFFTKNEAISHFYFTGGVNLVRSKALKRSIGTSNGVKKKVRLPKNTFAFCLSGKTLVIYHNPKRRNTFGKNAVRVKRITLSKSGETDLRFSGKGVPSPYANKVREGFYDRIDIDLL